MGNRRYSCDLLQGSMNVPCHFIFHGEEDGYDIEKIRNLIALLSTAQLIGKITVVDEYSKEEIVEMLKTWLKILSRLA